MASRSSSTIPRRSISAVTSGSYPRGRPRAACCGRTRARRPCAPCAPPYGPARHLAPLALARSVSVEPHDLRMRIARHLGEYEGEYEVEDDGDEWPSSDDDSTAIRPVPSSIGCARPPRWPRARRSICSRATPPSAGSSRPTSSSSIPTSLATTPPSPPRAAVSRSAISSRRTGPGSTITASLHEPVELAYGDVVTFGTTEARLQVESLCGAIRAVADR